MRVAEAFAARLLDTVLVYSMVQHVACYTSYAMHPSVEVSSMVQQVTQCNSYIMASDSKKFLSHLHQDVVSKTHVRQAQTESARS